MLKLNLIIDGKVDQLAQLAEQTGLQVSQDRLDIPSPIGEGSISAIRLPDGITLNHYHFLPRTPGSLRSIVPEEAGLFLANINLSRSPFRKQIDDKEVEIGRGGPAGCFFYSPGIEAEGGGNPGEWINTVILTFPQELLCLI